jgi:lipoyl(octanoyl) transferase
MDKRVLAFAKHLQTEAHVLGGSNALEWQVSRGPFSYPSAVAEMEERVAAIARGDAGELIWFLEHPALYTAGTSAKPADLIGEARFPVYSSGRGGQYTYHGPGQLVAYVMLDLNKRGRDVRCHVQRLEAWVIAALAPYGIAGERRAGRPGIWVRRPQMDAKIAALGVRVRHWITYHGIAINVCPDLSHFEGIVPCGITDAGITSIEALQLEAEPPLISH